MATEAGHRYTFGSPSKGWPTFGPDGKVIIEPTGEKVPHPQSCGGCHGAGCPVVRLVQKPAEEAPRVVDLMAALEESLRAAGARR